MAFKMKGLTPYRKDEKKTWKERFKERWPEGVEKDPKSQPREDSHMGLSQYDHEDVVSIAGRLKAMIQGMNPLYFLRMQKKWGKFARGFGGPGGGRHITNAGPEGRRSTYEQGLQKSIGDHLMTLAMRDTQGPNTQAGIAAQGVNIERVYKSPQFQQYLRKEMQQLTDRGGDPSKVQWDLWKGYDYEDGNVLSGDELTEGGISHGREDWVEGQHYREPTAEEKSRDIKRTGGRSQYATKKDQIKEYLGLKPKQSEKVEEWLDESDLA